jgi:hypothetical protein
MYKKLFIYASVISLFFLPASQIFAGGVKTPKIVVTTLSDTSRLVSVDWSNISMPQNYRWGLYRFDLEEKTFSLINELIPLQASYLDEELEPPLSKYYYRIERASLNGTLEKTTPERINQRDVQNQLRDVPIINTNEKITTNDRGVQTELPVNRKKPDSKTENQQRTSSFNEGIYIGVIGFSGKAADITQNPDGTPALVLLDGPGQQALIKHLSIGYLPSKSSGTALYYANHKALSNLSFMEKTHALPGNIDSVTIITFTDGTDTSSTDADFKPLDERGFKSSVAYRDFIKQQLSAGMINRRLPGVKKINAWSIGISGKDVQNDLEFTQTLQAVASGPEYVAEVSSVAQIEKTLLTIADELLKTYKPRINLTLSTPAYPIGTQLRITFDNCAGTPEISEKYIDTRVSWDESTKTYILNILGQTGVTIANNNLRLHGKRNELGIDYTVMIGDDFLESNVQQWYIQPGEDPSIWMQNREFVINKAADFTHERKSEIIYLVLDCSSSLTEKEIDNIRYAVVVFINKLYNALYDSSKNELLIAHDSAPVALNPVKTRVSPPSTAVTAPAATIQNIQTYQPPPASTVVTVKTPAPVSEPPAQVWQRPNSAFQFPPLELYQKPAVQARPTENRQASTAQVTRLPETTRQTETIRQPEAARSSSIASDTKTAPATPPQSTITSITSGNTLQNSFWVQIGSYSDVVQAQRSWRTFATTGIGNAEIFTNNIDGKLYYRVKVGPYISRMEAEWSLAQMKKYSSLEYNGSFITTE